MKEERAKAGLHLNIKRSEIMTTEEMHRFNTDNKDIEVVKDFAYVASVINSNRDWNQGKAETQRAATEELGKIAKS